MNKYKFSSTFLMAFFFISSVFGQQIINKVYDIPQKYKTPLENVDYFEADKFIPGIIWKVFSDRDNNPTYTKPGGTEVMKTLNYLEKFYVIEDTREYLHLIKLTDVEETGKLYEDYGWIRKDKLLLWMHCLITYPGIEDKRAMFVNTISYLETLDTMGIKNSRSVTFFKDPELTIPIEDNEGELYQIYYVYKVTEKAALIGKKNRCASDGSNVDLIIFGWVPKSRIEEWNHRIFIEPNPDKKAARERKNITTKVFLDKISASLYRRRKVIHKEYVIWDKDPLDERFMGDWYRFPILSEDKGILEIGILGEINQRRDTTGAIVSNVETPPKYVSSFTPEIVDYLWQLDSTASKLDVLYRENFQLYMRGYLTMDILQQEYPMYKLSMIWNRLELAEHAKKYELFQSATSSGNKRNNVKNVWINLLKSATGESNTKEFEKMTMEEINRKVFGLPVTGLSVKNVTLKDLSNSGIVPNDAFDDYIKHILDQDKEIKKILNRDEYEFSFKSNNKIYYWIIEDLLP